MSPWLHAVGGLAALGVMGFAIGFFFGMKLFASIVESLIYQEAWMDGYMARKREERK